MTNCFDNAGGTPSPQSESRQPLRAVEQLFAVLVAYIG